MNRGTLNTLAIAIVGALALLAFGGDPPSAAREASFVPLVELDEAGRVLRPGGEASQVTALSLFDARGGELLVARVRGRWRLVGHHLAPADAGLVRALIGELAEARPMVATPSTDLDARLEALDLVEGRARRVVLRGPDALKEDANGDVLVDVWIGAGGAVRRAGPDGAPRGEVLLLARDLDRFFSGPQTLTSNQLPPLALPFLVPPDWSGFEAGLERVFYDRANGTGFELERRIDPELPTGLTAWALREDPTADWREAHPVLSTGYTLFLGRAPVVRAVEPSSVPGSLTSRPDVRITLVSAGGELVELLVGAPRPDGSRMVVNMETQVAFELGSDAARLLTPPVAWLEDPSVGIPWDAFLR